MTIPRNEKQEMNGDIEVKIRRILFRVQLQRTMIQENESK